MYVALGSIRLFSHLDIMQFDTLIYFASCGCVSSLSILSSLILFPIVSIYWRFKDMVDGRTQPEGTVELNPSTGEVSQLPIDDLADKPD